MGKKETRHTLIYNDHMATARYWDFEKTKARLIEGEFFIESQTVFDKLPGEVETSTDGTQTWKEYRARTTDGIEVSVTVFFMPVVGG